jgi:hypothetical protein
VTLIIARLVSTEKSTPALRGLPAIQAFQQTPREAIDHARRASAL